MESSFNIFVGDLCNRRLPVEGTHSLSTGKKQEFMLQRIGAGDARPAQRGRE